MAAERITDTPQWHALARHYAEMKDKHLRELFAEQPARGEEMAVQAGDLYLDYSKNRVTRDTLRLLLDLADRARLREQIEAMFTGQKINVTEDRAVLHVALRAPMSESVVVDGVDVVPHVHAVLDKMGDF